MIIRWFQHPEVKSNLLIVLGAWFLVFLSIGESCDNHMIMHIMCIYYSLLLFFMQHASVWESYSRYSFMQVCIYMIVYTRILTLAQICDNSCHRNYIVLLIFPCTHIQGRKIFHLWRNVASL